MRALVLSSSAQSNELGKHRYADPQVAPLEDVVALADIFVTCTGNRDVIRLEHMAAMKHGAVLANMGHFEGEIDFEGLLGAKGVGRRTIKPQVCAEGGAGGRAGDRGGPMARPCLDQALPSLTS